MTVTVSNIIPSKQAESSQTSQYTSSNAKTIIDKFTATNTSGGAVTISVNIIAASDAADDDNLIVKEKSILAGETSTFPELVNQTLNSGQFISTIASAATSLTIRASGRIVT